MKKLLFLSILTLSCLASYGASPAQMRYFKDRVRIIGQTVVSNQVVTTYMQGKKVWAVTNVVKVINEPEAVPIKYSKLKLIVAAKEAGKWDALKSAIIALKLEDEWQACQFISSDYPAYIAATNAVVSQGIATDEDVKAFMKKAEDN